MYLSWQSCDPLLTQLQANEVLFVDAEKENEVLTFREVFLGSRALELLVAGCPPTPHTTPMKQWWKHPFALCFNHEYDGSIDNPCGTGHVWDSDDRDRICPSSDQGSGERSIVMVAYNTFCTSVCGTCICVA